MDLYTQEDMRCDKRIAILKYAAVAAVFASFIALASINTPVFTW